jgi:hypothetical protein
MTIDLKYPYTPSDIEDALWSKNEQRIWNARVNFTDLIGKTIRFIGVNANKELVVFECTDGTEYAMFHDQDCCESVYLEDIVGDLQDLLESPITLAEERSKSIETDEGSSTFTFYELATIKGYVTLRWGGYSNGYYSESVDFCLIKCVNED